MRREPDARASPDSGMRDSTPGGLSSSTARLDDSRTETMAEQTAPRGDGDGEPVQGRVCQNFLRQFQEGNACRFQRFTATQFIDVWNHYDKDGR